MSLYGRCPKVHERVFPGPPFIPQLPQGDLDQNDVTNLYVRSRMLQIKNKSYLYCYKSIILFFCFISRWCTASTRLARSTLSPDPPFAGRTCR